MRRDREGRIGERRGEGRREREGERERKRGERERGREERLRELKTMSQSGFVACNVISSRSTLVVIRSVSFKT